jgi:hypothetical protein
MNESELKRLWQEQTRGAAPVFSRVELERVKQRARKFQRTILWRDVREVSVAVGVAVWFGCGLARPQSGLTRAGNVIVILAAVFIAARLWLSHRLERGPGDGKSVRDTLLIALKELDHQIHLLQTVLWWYLLPVLGGCTLAVLGRDVPAGSKAVSLAVFVGIGWFLRWINLYAVKKSLLPMRRDLEAALNALGEQSEDNQI